MPTRTTWTQWRLQTAPHSCSSLAAMTRCARCGTGGRCGRTDRSLLVIWLAIETASPSSIARSEEGKPSQTPSALIFFFSFWKLFTTPLPGRCTISDQQLQGSVHQALGHQEVFSQRGAGSFPPGCDPAELGLSLAAGSPERWETELLRVIESRVERRLSTVDGERADHSQVWQGYVGGW